ncbi:hypothetical protein RI844_11285 [Thalassotalea fonticola]|uniref:Prenyltransferase n=1 Tax=Thalassotalea fonticola TaxID=3065649 RepID=A0ABZ0GJB8_9GAMM|nr:hypothetical protein RI844_11285 [Colwelliaceae bacterium S1-1]
MPVAINLFLSAIRPITFFLPCAAIILGAGLSAYSGVVDGPLFVSLLTLALLAQITINLGDDYQRAFITSAAVLNQQSQSSQKQMHVRYQMLRLILGCFILFSIGIIILCKMSTDGSFIAYGLAGLCAMILLMILRIKTRQASVSKPISIAAIMANILLLGFLPTLVSYYLHTSKFNYSVVGLAFCAGLLVLSVLFTGNLKQQITKDAGINSENLTPAFRLLLNVLLVLIAVVFSFTLAIIYFAELPLFSGLFIFTLPSFVGSIMTVKHLPEEDVTQTQISKLIFTCFAFWILFVIGLML